MAMFNSYVKLPVGQMKFIDLLRIEDIGSLYDVMRILYIYICITELPAGIIYFHFFSHDVHMFTGLTGGPHAIPPVHCARPRAGHSDSDAWRLARRDPCEGRRGNARSWDLWRTLETPTVNSGEDMGR